MQIPMNKLYLNKENRNALLGLLFLLLIQAALVFWHVQQEVHEIDYWKAKTLRVGYLPSEKVHAELSPYGPGFEKELVELFCQKHGLTPQWIKMQNFGQGIEGLDKGLLHLFLAGPGLEGLEKAGIVKGPYYLKSRMIVVHNQGRYPLNSLHDLCSTDLVIPDRPPYRQKLDSLENLLECMLEPVKTTEPGQPFFRTLSDRRFRFGLMDELSFKLWKGLYPEVRKTYAFEGNRQHRWLWSGRQQDLHENLEVFWEQVIQSGKLAELSEKYYGFFPANQDPYQLRHFVRVLHEDVPRYTSTILDAAEKYRLDPLLLVALIYQESHFDPQASSRTGVRGLLQLTMQTAAFLGVENRLDPHESILGGAKYLSILLESVEEMGIESWDRWFFALAAYNQGLGHVYDARTLAERQGLNPDSWSGLKQAYPLLSYRKYYEDLPRGYARGFEAVQFVENVRFYYYLLYGLLSLARPEVEHLGSFLDFVPPDWPE